MQASLRPVGLGSRLSASRKPCLPARLQRAALAASARAHKVRPHAGPRAPGSGPRPRRARASSRSRPSTSPDDAHCPSPAPPARPQEDSPSSSSAPAAAALAALLAAASAAPAACADFAPPPQQSTQAAAPATLSFPGAATQAAPALAGSGEYALPEGAQWRYSDFIEAVQKGKVERVRFAKDGAQLQLTAVDGRRALVVLPNDPELVDILAKAGVDISVSEGEQQGSFVSLLGNLLFPLIAFAGLFLLFRRAGDGSVSVGGRGRPRVRLGGRARVDGSWGVRASGQLWCWLVWALDWLWACVPRSRVEACGRVAQGQAAFGRSL